MKKSFIIFCFLFSGCLVDTEVSSETDTEYWICNNKESIHHNRLCHNDCYEQGNPHKYCWLLYEPMCYTPDPPSDVIDACKIFE